jgi:hypothetical protein
VDRRNLGDRFHFDDYAVFNHQIGPKADFEPDILVDDRDRLLLDHRQPSLPQFMSERLLYTDSSKPGPRTV